jgi:hypothetical protein
VLLQAEVNNSDDEDEEGENKGNSEQNPNETSTPKEPPKLYPTAPTLDDSSDANSTASAHSTSV